MEQKDFSYEGHAVFKIPEIEIKEVKFLIPVKVSYQANGEWLTVLGQIDMANKNGYFNSHYDKELTQKIFEFIESSSKLPEDMYEVDEDLYNKAAEINEQAGNFSKGNYD